MNKNRGYTTDINILFRKWLSNAREIVQDTIFHARTQKVQNNISFKRFLIEQDDHSHYFSDTCKKHVQYIFKENPLLYARNKNSYKILKNLQKEQYNPEIFLDLHGLTQYQAQKELGRLILTCQKEKIFCAQIMHGYGKYILKKQTPFWLSQHPDIIAFHEAPKIFGSDAAIIVIIDIKSF